MFVKRKTLYVSIGTILLLFFIAGCLLSTASQQSGVIAPGSGGDAESDNPPANPDNPVQPVSNDPGDRPPAPSNLRADHIPIFDVLVEWDDQSANEDGFRIYRRRVDQLTPLWIAGEVAADTTAFQDGGTLCGATYQYIVASFNEAGESPATACWQITLPPCTPTQTVDLGFGADAAYDFVRRLPTPSGDFYIDFDDAGQAEFRADGDGQNGLVSLGEIGNWPLAQVTLPADVAYTHDGLPAHPGETYAALARDGSSVVVFRLDALGSTARLHALVWFDIDLIDPGVCEPTLLVDNPPGNPCISGDDVCNPDCITAPEEHLGETGSVRELLDLLNWGDEVVELVGPVDWGPAVGGDDHRTCADQAYAMLPDDPTPADIAEADAFYLACLADAGLVPVREGGAGAPLPEHPDEEMFREPTLTEVDYDCESACVPEDGLCDATCGGEMAYVPEDYRFEAMTDIDGDGFMEARFIWSGTGDPTYGPYWYLDINDEDCYPGELPPPEFICFEGDAFMINPAFELMDSEDRDGDGEPDLLYFVNLDPTDPEYRKVVVVDFLCHEPHETFICSAERPAALTDDYVMDIPLDRNGDGIWDAGRFVNLNPDSPDFHNVIVWDTLCSDSREQTFCSLEPPSAITPDYTLIHSTDRDGDGDPDLMVFAILDPAHPQYGSRIIWDTLCEQTRQANLNYCGPDEPSWLNEDDWDVVTETATEIHYRNINPDSPYYGAVGVWNFGPNCSGQPRTETVVEEVWYCEYLGRGRYQWYTVARTFVDGVAVSEEIVSGPYTGGWQPNCPAGQDPEEEPEETEEPPACICREMCVRWSQGTTTHIECLEYDYIDCNGDPCEP